MNDRVDPLRLIRAEPLAGSGLVVPPPTSDSDSDEAIFVERRGTVVSMRRAVSCLVVPQTGDRVWWCTDPDDVDGVPWVTQVLSRGGAGPLTLRLPADATLLCDGGALRVRAGELHLEPDSLHVRTRHALVVFETAETIGACWQGVVTAMRWTGSTLTSVVDRITTIAKTRLQVTEGSDAVRAGTFDLRAKGLATVHAEHLLIDGERLVKTRAPQIHMG